jgi:hypothetical protein
MVASKDPEVPVPTPGSPGDPTTGDGALEVRNPTTGESTVLPLPAAMWRGLGAPPGTTGYRYDDPTHAAGPCTRVITDARRIEAGCNGAGIGFSLNEGSQGGLAVRLTTGTGELRRCLLWGASSVVHDRPGLFDARNAPAPGACP